MMTRPNTAPALLREPVEAHEHIATIADAERVAEREAKAALERAREHVRGLMKELAAPAGSPLYGNGLHKALSDALAKARDLDSALERIGPTLHAHFHGGDET